MEYRNASTRRIENRGRRCITVAASAIVPAVLSCTTQYCDVTNSVDGTKCCQNNSRKCIVCIYIYIYIYIKLHGLSPRANYTDRATAACRRSDCQLFADRGCHVVSVTDPYGRILGFLDRSRYFSIK
jgi:hypothetical protein